MKRVRQLILAVTCFALAAVMVCSGILYIAFYEPPLQTPDDGEINFSTEDNDSEASTTPSSDPVDKGEQNLMLITPDEFKNPANRYRALRIAHEYVTLPGENLADKVQKLADYGFGGVITNDVWDGRYLQNASAMAQLNAFVQGVHNAGLRVWLYDEKGYPSGSAGDLTCQGHPEYEAVRLTQITVKGNGKADKTVEVPSAFVKVECAYLKTDSGYIPADVTVKGSGITVKGAEGSWTAYVYCVTKYNFHFEWNNSYPNILNREAIARYIEVTFDTYERGIENLNGIVEAFFDDEAQLLAVHHITPEGLTNPVIPYDYDIFDSFAKKYGYDPRPLLPLLFNDTSDVAQRLRSQFYAHVGDLVSENYFGQIQAWCKAHGVQLSGHLLLEEQMFYHVPVYGNYIQCSLSMGWPGFDILDPRPLNYLNNMSTGGKYASSPAWLSGQERVFVEICPVANPDEFATNHLDYALGTMTFAYFDGGNQLATYYVQANGEQATGRAFNEYVGRLGSMTVGAQNTTEIAIYYSVDTVAGQYISPDNQNLYSACTAARKNDETVSKLAEGLRARGLDYVFLDSVSMQAGKAEDGVLRVGNFGFKTILVPKATVMRIEDIRILDTLMEQGCEVIFVGNMPSIAFKEADQAELEDFVSRRADALMNLPSRAARAVTTTVALTVASKQNVLVSPYRKDGVEFFFLANASYQEASMTFTYEGAVGYRLYDPVTGEITEVSAQETCELAPYRALFVQPLMED
jgi:hypothetical protein